MAPARRRRDTPLDRLKRSLSGAFREGGPFDVTAWRRRYENALGSRDPHALQQLEREAKDALRHLASSGGPANDIAARTIQEALEDARRLRTGAPPGWSGTVKDPAGFLDERAIDARSARVPWNHRTSLDGLNKSAKASLQGADWAGTLSRFRGNLARRLFKSDMLAEGEVEDVIVAASERINDLKQEHRFATEAEKAKIVAEVNEIAQSLAHLRAFRDSYAKGLQEALFTRAQDLADTTSRLTGKLQKLPGKTRNDLAKADALLAQAKEELKAEENRLAALAGKSAQVRARRHIEAAKANLNAATERREAIEAEVEAAEEKAALEESLRASKEDKQARAEGRKADSLVDLARKERQFKRDGNIQGLRNAQATRKELARKELFEGELARARRERKRLRELRNGAEGQAYEEYDELLREMDSRIQSMQGALDEAVEKGDYTRLDAPDFTVGPVARARTYANLKLGGLREGVERFRDHTLRPVRSSRVYKGAVGEAKSAAQTTAYGLLWRLQANRYRQQQHNALKAQRKARSSAWQWYYRFSDSVSRPVAVALFMAPVMVPWGILQVAGWMAFVAIAFILNWVWTIGVQIGNLGLFSILSVVNILGSAVQGAADWMAIGLLSQLGQCPTPAEVAAGSTAPCVYKSLAFGFGIRTLDASPLLDPRFFFPTTFHTNSILSVLLDFAGDVPWYAIAGAIGVVALFVPIVVMESDDWLKRVLVGVVIGLVAIPAVGGQVIHSWCEGEASAADGGDVSCDFYHKAADAFRTGGRRVFVAPAEAFARDALEAVTGGEPT